MAKRCLYGCGRKVAMTRHPMSTSGERVTETMRTLEEMTDTDELREPMPPGFLRQGERLQAGLLMITHDETHPRNFAVGEIGAWLREAWTSSRK